MEEYPLRTLPPIFEALQERVALSEAKFTAEYERIKDIVRLVEHTNRSEVFETLYLFLRKAIEASF
jgi:hypothetical protein